MPLRKSGSAVAADAVARPRSEAAVSNRHSSANDEPVATAGHAHAAPETGAGGTPGRSAAASSVVGQDAFPIQTTKVQRPPLRAETLRRDRLLEWLTVAFALWSVALLVVGIRTVERWTFPRAAAATLLAVGLAGAVLALWAVLPGR